MRRLIQSVNYAPVDLLDVQINFLLLISRVNDPDRRLFRQVNRPIKAAFKINHRMMILSIGISPALSQILKFTEEQEIYLYSR